MGRECFYRFYSSMKYQNCYIFSSRLCSIYTSAQEKCLKILETVYLTAGRSGCLQQCQFFLLPLGGVLCPQQSSFLKQRSWNTIMPKYQSFFPCRHCLKLDKLFRACMNCHLSVFLPFCFKLPCFPFLLLRNTSGMSHLFYLPPQPLISKLTEVGWL